MRVAQVWLSPALTLAQLVGGTDALGGVPVGGGAVAELAVVVGAPAPQGATGAGRTAVVTAGADARPAGRRTDSIGCESVGGGAVAELTVGVVAPAPQGATGAGRTGVAVAGAHARPTGRRRCCAAACAGRWWCRRRARPSLLSPQAQSVDPENLARSSPAACAPAAPFSGTTVAIPAARSTAPSTRLRLLRGIVTVCLRRPRPHESGVEPGSQSRGRPSTGLVSVAMRVPRCCPPAGIASQTCVVAAGDRADRGRRLCSAREHRGERTQLRVESTRRRILPGVAATWWVQRGSATVCDDPLGHRSPI